MSQGQLRSLLPEFLRWAAGELIAGRVGRFHLTFHSFLANKILKGELKGVRLTAALRFVMVESARAHDTKCLDILAYRHADSLPLDLVGNETLAALHSYAIRQPYREHALVCEAVRREATKRAAEDSKH